MATFLNEDFVDVLVKNGIKLPPYRKKPTLRMWYFLKKWGKASNLYCQMKAERKSANFWKNYFEARLNAWGMNVSVGTDPVELKFKFPKEAEKLILEEIRRAREVQTEGNLRETEAKQRWVEGIIKKAPKECRLIVIKNTTFVPKKENAERFERSVSKGEC